jgi:ribonuclease HII
MASRAAHNLRDFPELAEGSGWVCSLEFERQARAAGARRVAGVDEVGRGPLFGPVVAAAVMLPETCRELDFAGLTDSKQLSEAERKLWDARVREAAVCWAVAEVDVETIDRINILQASRLAMRLAVEALGERPDFLLIDGNQRIDANCAQRSIVQGDGRSLSIAAASVVAKVHRDRLMCDLDGRFPGYGLARNKGYGTPEHKRALLQLGATAMHRRSFAPVAALFGEAGMAQVDESDELDFFEELDFVLED